MTPEWVTAQMIRLGVSDFRTDIQLDGSTVVSGILTDDYPFQFVVTPAEMLPFKGDDLADYLVDRMREAIVGDEP